MIGTVITFHYLNRKVNALLIESPLPAQTWLHTPLIQTLSFIFRLKTKQTFPTGATLDLLPKAPLPADLQWAEASPSIAGAFAGFALVVEAAG